MHLQMASFQPWTVFRGKLITGERFMRIDSRPHHFWIYSRRYVDIFSIPSFFLLFFTTHLLYLYNRAGERASSGQRLNTNKN